VLILRDTENSSSTAWRLLCCMAWDFGIKWNKTFARRCGFTEKRGHVSQKSNMQLFLTWLSLR